MENDLVVLVILQAALRSNVGQILFQKKTVYVVSLSPRAKHGLQNMKGAVEFIGL